MNKQSLYILRVATLIMLSTVIISQLKIEAIFLFCLFSILTFTFGFAVGNDTKPAKETFQPNCPECKNGALCAIRSQNVKKCSSCGYEQSWHLDPGQKPLITNNRHDRKSNN